MSILLIHLKKIIVYDIIILIIWKEIYYMLAILVILSDIPLYIEAFFEYVFGGLI